MTRAALTEQDYVLMAFSEASEAYNEQRLSFMESFIHSKTVDDSVKRFGAALKAPDYKAAIVTRLNQKYSEWNSSRTKSFNSHFLRALERHAPALSREVIAESHKVRFFEADDVVLYRADTRRPATIFAEGFKPRFAKERVKYRVDYGNQVTSDLGVSTTQSHAFARDWGGTVYTMRFKGDALRDPRLEALDIVETGKQRKCCHCSDCIRYSVAEVNFISSIPPQFIESAVTTSGQRLMNPGFTGQFTPVAMASSAVSASASLSSAPAAVASSACATGASSGVGSGSGAAAGAGRYAVGTNVSITGYAFDVQLCKGGKGRAHLVFTQKDDATAFVATEDLRSERDASKLKTYDAKRYHGLFAVRTNKAMYESLKSKHAELPSFDDLPAAPAYR